MTPYKFPEANGTFGPPLGVGEEDCGRVPTHTSIIDNPHSAFVGARRVIVAWKPTPEELAKLNAGEPVFIASIGGLMPHYVGASFEECSRV